MRRAAALAHWYQGEPATFKSVLARAVLFQHFALHRDDRGHPAWTWELQLNVDQSINKAGLLKVDSYQFRQIYSSSWECEQAALAFHRFWLITSGFVDMVQRDLYRDRGAF